MQLGNMYESLLRSTLTYASPAWVYAAKTGSNTLQTFQNKGLRVLIATYGNIINKNRFNILAITEHESKICQNQ